MSLLSSLWCSSISITSFLAQATTPEVPDGEEGTKEVESVLENATKMPDPKEIDIEQLIADLLPMLTAVALRCLGVIILLIVAWMIARWIKSLVRTSLERAHVEETVRKFTTALIGWGVILLALILSLGIFGVDTTVFAGILGAIGLAVGLGFQGALANLAAGVMLLIFRPFRVGDLVEIDGELGIVEEVELYFTRINGFDNKHIIVTNDDVLSNKIENLSRNKRRRVDIPVGVDYSADPRKTRKVLESVLDKVEGAVEDDMNAVVFKGFGDSSVNWEVRVACPWDKWLSVRQSALHEVWDALAEAEIGIPFPQRDLHLDQPVQIRIDRASNHSEDEDD